MKKYLIGIFILMFTFIGSVSAKEIVEISNVSISDKTNTMVAKVDGYNGLTLNTKELFYEVGEYVTYNITIKNNTGNSLSVDKISDSISNEYVETSYDYDKKEIKSDEEYSFNITLKYKKEITDNSKEFNLPINIIINYTNGSSTSILVNPDTKDNVLIYFIIFVLSAISLILFKTKKKKLLVFVVSLGLIPSIAYAVNNKDTLTINNEIGIYKRLAIMDTGITVNKKIKTLAGTDISVGDEAVDSNIKHIVRARELPNNITDNNKISKEDSLVPIYAWYDNGTIYYYTEVDTIYLNENSFGLFSNLSKLENIDMDIFNTSMVTLMPSMFYGDESLKKLDVSKFDTSNVTNMYALFYDCKSLTELDLSNFDTSKVINMSGMFSLCAGLKNLDLSNFDTSKVTNMRAMFYDCVNLSVIDTRSFDTSNVTDMGWMFGAYAGKVMKITELDLSHFNTSNVTAMDGMFQNATNLRKLIVNKFDTSKVTTMRYMFCDCSSLTELDVSNFDTSNVTDMLSMFEDCRNLTSLDLSSFNTSKVTTMRWMFTGDEGPWEMTSIDISSFDTSKVTDMYRMFYNLGNTTTIYVGDKFTTAKVTSSNQMFLNTKKIVGGNGTTYDSTKTNKEYARVDKDGIPGYFTLKN